MLHMKSYVLDGADGVKFTTVRKGSACLPVHSLRETAEEVPG